MEDWDQPRRLAPGRRALLAAGVLAAVTVTGALFARWMDGPGAGALDVRSESAVGQPPAPDADADAREPLEGADERGGGADNAAAVGASVAWATGAWTRLPEAPIAERGGHVLAWSGTEMIVWGGTSRAAAGRRVFFDDGAALDPVSGTWRGLEASPLAPRLGAASAWTGGELVVWGGIGRSAHFADGAVYDPIADRWEPLPPAPLAPRQRPLALWTGRELIIAGGRDFGGPLDDAAAYDPARGAWRPLPPLPEELAPAWELDGVWTGEMALVWATRGPATRLVAGYDPAVDGWISFPGAGTGSRLAAVWSGEELLAMRRSRLLAWRPGAADWEERARAPFVQPWDAEAVWLGDRLAVLQHGNRARAGVYDPVTDVWRRMPAPPSGASSGPGVWTGEALLTWGSSGHDPPTTRTGGAAFVPGDEP